MSGVPAALATAQTQQRTRLGIPGLTGVHIGLTVPDLEATHFFVDVIGGRILLGAVPFLSDDYWLAQHLGVHPRAVINKLRMIKLHCGPALELFEYTAPDQRHELSSLTWLYFLAPWELQLEIVSAPADLAYANAGGEPMWRPETRTA